MNNQQYDIDMMVLFKVYVLNDCCHVLFVIVEELSIEFLSLSSFLYITQVLPVIFPLKWFYSETLFYTKYFTLSFSTEYPFLNDTMDGAVLLDVC